MAEVYSPVMTEATRERTKNARAEYDLLVAAAPQAVRNGLSLLQNAHGHLVREQDPQLGEVLIEYLVRQSPQHERITQIINQRGMPFPNFLTAAPVDERGVLSIICPQIKDITGHDDYAIPAFILGPDELELYRLLCKGEVPLGGTLTASFNYQTSAMDGTFEEVINARVPVVVLPNKRLHEQLQMPVPLAQIRAHEITHALDPFLATGHTGAWTQDQSIGHELAGLAAEWLVEGHAKQEISPGYFFKYLTKIIEAKPSAQQGAWGKMNEIQRANYLFLEDHSLRRAFLKRMNQEKDPSVFIRQLMRGDDVVFLLRARDERSGV